MVFTFNRIVLKTRHAGKQLFCLFNQIFDVFQNGRITHTQRDTVEKVFFSSPEKSRMKYLNFEIFGKDKRFLANSYINTNAS